MHRLIFILSIGLFCLVISACSPAAKYADVTPERALSFPKDHFSHHDFRTEWWYYTGHIKTVDDRQYGFELVFFRHRTEGLYRFGIPVWKFANPIYFSHFAITDEAGRTFHYAEKVGRAKPLKGGSLEDALLIWVEDWRCEMMGNKIHLTAKLPDDSFAVDLVLEGNKPPVAHGENGISKKGVGGPASYYISITRFDVQGFLKVAGVPKQIAEGAAWSDHEIFSGTMSNRIKGWDWFSIQLDDNHDIMAFLLHNNEGKIDPYSSGTMIFPDGQTEHFTSSQFSIEEIDWWVSDKTGAKYPVAWKIWLPGYDGELSVKATLDDQELIMGLSGVKYWEGSVLIEGTMLGKSVKGRGYVEMSGRAGDLNGL